MFNLFLEVQPTETTLTPGLGGVTVTVAPLDAEHELVTLRAPLPAPQALFRLRATRR